MAHVAWGGCIFCGEQGSGEHLVTDKDIETQVKNYFKSYKAERANKFIAYFQNFSNTYDSVENLKKKYDSALIDDRIIGLAVATRSDCINEDVVKLLKSYTNKYYVYVELGLQTSNNETGKIINRGYDSEIFSKAVTLFNKYGIDVVAHMMVGLPGENFENIKNTVKFLNNHRLQGIKIHSTYVIKGTKLAEMYLNGEYTPLTLEEYIEIATYIIANINPEFIIHRISGDAPKDLLIAPEWNLHKKWIMNGIEKMLVEKDVWQGKGSF